MGAPPRGKRLLRLMRFRNEYPAFGGTFELLPCEAHELRIRRRWQGSVARLYVDFRTRRYTVRAGADGHWEVFDTNVPEKEWV